MISKQEQPNPCLSISCGEELVRTKRSPKTLAELLKETASGPDSTKGIVYLRPDGSELFQSYADLWKDALRIVEAFRQLSLSPNAPLILALEDNGQLIPSFWGGVLAGAVVAPLAAPSTFQHENSAAKKFEDIWRFLDFPPIITNRHRLVELCGWAEALGLKQKIQAFAIEDLLLSNVGTVWHQARPEDLSLLFFTSGSVGAPKGVMLSHENLLSMVMGTVQFLQLSNQDVTFNWMPFDHVAAFGMMHLPAVLLGQLQINLPTQTILLDPLKWLEGMSHYQATFSWAPNFAFGMICDCAKEIQSKQLDLSSIRYLLNGGEAVSARVGHRFLSLLQPKGLPPNTICPAWGMSETSSGVIYSRDFVQSNENDPFVAVGAPIPGFSVRIVDENNRLLPEGTIGRLQVSGPSVTKGYYQQPMLNQKAFTSDGWFDTGDCGFLTSGRLTLTGRSNDAIIINGANYYGHMIEAVIEELPEIVSSYTAACAIRRPEDITDQLVIFFVHSVRDENELFQLLRKINYHLAQTIGVTAQYLVPLEREQIPKTNIGKIKRSKLKAAFEEGSFSEILQKLQNSTLEKREKGKGVQGELTELMIDQLQINGPIDLDTNIHSLGINSILMIKFIREIEKRYHIKLQARDFYQYPTIRSLVDYLGQSTVSELPPIESRQLPIQDQDRYPLSEIQKGLWAIQKISPLSIVYNLPLCFRVSSSVNVGHLKQAFQLILQRYPILKGRVEESGGPFLKVQSIENLPFYLLENEKEINQCLKTPFDLEKDVLIRLYLFSESQERHVLLFVIHHLVFDGISSLVFLQSFLETYQSLIENKSLPHSHSEMSYADFVAWEKQMLSNSIGKGHSTYWRQKLSGVSCNFDTLFKSTVGSEKKTFSIGLDHKLVTRLRKFAQDRSKSVSSILLSIYMILLNRCSGQEEIVIGMPVVNRPEERFDAMIGLFLNLLPIRETIRGDFSYLEFLDHLQLTILDSLDHAAYPLSKMIRDLDGPSFLQAAFFYQNFFYSSSYGQLCKQYRKTIDLEFVPEVQQEGEFPLVVEIWDVPDGMTLNVKQSAELFIDNFPGRYIKLIEDVINYPKSKINDFVLVSEKEKTTLLYDWNATRKEYPDLCFNTLFRQQVRQNSHAIAVSSEEGSLTYAELDAKSSDLAHHLQRSGVGPEKLVGICLKRSLNMVVGLLAIIKSGGAYVPLDPSYPSKFIDHILKDSQVQWILTQEQFHPLLAPYGVELISMDQVPMSDIEKDWASDTRRLAYVIYTSGSTGLPKGVMIEHRSLSNFLLSMASEPGIYSQDRLLALTTYNFDIAALELFLPLILGAHCHIAPSGKNPDQLKALIQKVKPTIMQATPSTWSILFQSGWKNEEGIKILTGGEALPLPLMDKMLQTQNEVWNLYGPTETTVWSTVQHLEKGGSHTIGKPIANTQVYILDHDLHLLPIGLIGELFISGAGVARGYWQRPELTAEKFIDNPFVPGEKMYRTGDLARWLSNGQLEYLGRKDLQVKIRGHRIELEAIESYLAAHRGVSQNAVIVKQDGDHKKLVSYYVPSEAGASLSSEQLRLYLQTTFPDYMVPAHFIRLAKLPLTPNGKVDRKDLMLREIVLERAAPLSQSQTEEKLLSIWRDLLHVNQIGIHDRFFDVGGDSVLAVSVVERIKKELGCHLSVTEFFTYPNIEALSQHLCGKITSDLNNQSADIQNPSADLPEYYKDSIAIIGISCQFPGAKNQREFWDNLIEGKEGVKFFNKGELADLNVPQNVIEDPAYIAAEASIEGQELFDPDFFQISAKDAEMMDPQLRLLLLHSWKAVEDAGYVPTKIPDTCVYISASNNLYRSLLPHQHILEDADSYVAWILSQSGTIPTLISHKFGFKGPSFFVHSNCSSSLVGLYQAFQTLKLGESPYALVGAASLHLLSQIGYLHQPGLNFSSDGRIKAFDADADGMIGGEGVAVILLKRALDAIADGDHIYAILRGVGLNNDGAEKVGFYAPSLKGQSDVIKKVLQSTGVDPESIGYIEAHGTGTKIGDPIEVGALTQAFRTYTDKKNFCGIGSVKSNIGHLDTAAGLAGLIKVALSLSHQQIPPTINYKNANPELQLEDSPFYVIEKKANFKEGAIARAALSSFGLGGTNGHAILERAITRVKAAKTTSPYYIPFSAKNEETLRAYLKEFEQVIETVNLENLAYTLQVGRQEMACRVLFIVQTVEELKEKIGKYLSGGYRGESEHPWCRGKAHDWGFLYPAGNPDRISLPTYPFALKRIWPDAEYTAPELGQEEIKIDISQQIKSIAAKVIKAEAEAIRLEADWNEYGFDSITFVQLANQINLEFQTEITPALFFEYKTIKSFVEFFGQKRPNKDKKNIKKPQFSRVSTKKTERFEPIAIIGMSGKFPGAADLDEFWSNLLEERESITEIPPDRWDWREYFGDPIKEENKTNVIKGGFIDSVAEFDPLFFGISPKEAHYMDPQHRLLLMYAWKAIEDAGYSPKSLSGTSTGVFIGTGNTGYRDLFVQAKIPIDGYSATGHMIPSLGPNRLSYFLDLHGPSEPVETSCSSSLVAIHRAVSTLQDGSCDLAIAGGVNTIVNPDGYISYGKAGMLSLDGKCKTFSREANGYVRGEGVGIILLKKLEDAERDRDHIYGVIRASFENHGGRANTLTSPNPTAQTKVIVGAYQRGGINPSEISYIEAHGSGTQLGDPIEINGLKAAFAQFAPSVDGETSYCGIGSVKTNIGHLEVAAGISGLIKVLLQLKHRTLVKSLYSESLNPYIDLKNSPFYIVQEKTPWKARKSELPRKAGVSSFGIGGVNVHLVIEEYIVKKEPNSIQIAPAMILLSAKTEEALLIQAEQLLQAVRKKHYQDADLEQIAFTLQVGREAMEERLSLIVNNIEDLEEKLAAFIDGKKEIKNLYHGRGSLDPLGEIAEDEDIEVAIEAWLSKGKLSKLLNLWVKGGRINWSKLYSSGHPRRINLPTYPFAKDRYWLPEKKGNSQKKSDRQRYFLFKEWEQSPSKSAKKEGKAVLILAGPDTLNLAKAVARNFPRHMIVNLAQTPFLPSACDWKGIDGLIDLVGCSKQEDLSIDWVCWLQHLIEHGHKNGLMLLGVTKGLESFQNPSPNMSGALRAGLYRMLQSEYSHLKSRHLDLDYVEEPILADLITEEFFLQNDDPEVCIRNQFRYRCLLKPRAFIPKTISPALFPEGHVLVITGGMRGLGLLFAKHFVKIYGVKKLVLIGREPLPPKEEWGKNLTDPVAKKIKAIQELESQGVQVQPLALRLYDLDEVQRHLLEIKKSMGPIGGVIHCAGVVDMNTLAFIRKTAEKIHPVIEPKIFGTRNLYQVLHKEPLKFFILFSSVSATIPYLSAGQADYTMANAYLDYFAQAHSNHCPLISIQWPNWKESGMGEVTHKAYKESGILSITDVEGLEFIDHILSHPLPTVVLPAVIDPALFKPNQLMAHVKVEKPVIKSPETPVLQVPTQDHTMKWLVELFAHELKMNPEKFKVDKPFQDYGVDSIILVQILHHINLKIAANLDPSILYEYPTIQSFAGWLIKTYGQINAPTNFVQSPAQEQVATSAPILAPAPNGEEIAVVGMSCRFAGADSIEAFWELLSQGRSGILPIPPTRFASSFFGGMVDPPDVDPQFFHIQEEDAKEMDPQAFLILEESMRLWYEAGYSHQEVKGKKIGVYIGGRSQHKPTTEQLLQMRNPILGVGQNYLAANVSHFFDLHGPSLVLDTACSSALVCLNIAIQALRNQEIEAAVVGGVSYLENDAVHQLFHQRGILSERPEFHLFDQRAKGIVLGEGVGVVLLKTLKKALEDGDRIEAIIKGIAINNDGRTAGPATPNFEAQKQVMQTALFKSGIQPEKVEYLEANGSGSIVTDLLELKAIQAVYHPSSNQSSLKLGSVKPNIGHPLCAEGIASFIKVVLMLKHRQIVPFLSGQQELEHFDQKAAHLEFSRALENWGSSEPVAAINCFADGGTNVHLILQAAQHGSSNRAPMPQPVLKRRSKAEVNIWESLGIES